LIIGVIFQPAIDGFVSKRIFYLQKPDIIVKKDYEKITLSHGDPGYDEISHQALDMIFSYNDFISQTSNTFQLVVPTDTGIDAVAGGRSYVRITTNSPFGKRIYVVMIDPFDAHGGQIYHSKTGNGWRAYAAKDPEDFETLQGMIENLKSVVVRQSGGSHLLAAECADREYISGKADYIIEGTVEKVESKWNHDRTFIFTYTDLAIENYVKGVPFPEDELQIVTPGGEVGDVGIAVEDQPIFHEGKRVRIYLQGTGREFSIVCSEMGIEEIEKVLGGGG